MRLAVLLLAVSAFGQDLNSISRTASGNITGANSSCLGYNCVWIAPPPNANAVTVQITGTFSGTVVFEATTTGVSYSSVAATNGDTSATATGTWNFPLYGYRAFRVRGSAYVSGPVVVSIGAASATTAGTGGWTDDGSTITAAAGRSVTIGDTVLAGVAGSQSIISGTIANTSVDSAVAVNIASTGTSSGHFNGVWITYSPEMASHSNDNSAILGYFSVGPGNAANYSVRQSGVYGLMRHAGTGTMGDARGVYGTAGVFGAGNMTVGSGVRGFVSNSGSGVITYASALHASAASNSGAGSITNNYGIYIENPTAGGTSNYSIYSEGGTNYLVGPVTSEGAIKTTGGAVTAQRDALTTVTVDGLVAVNTTDAAAGVQQQSPRIRLTGQGWKTASTAASQTVDWTMYVNPIQGSSAPASQLLFRQQINGGGYATVLTLGSDGGITTGGNMSAAGDIIATSNNAFDLGSSGTYWRQGFIRSLFVSTTATIAGSLLIAQQTPASAGASCTANTFTADTGFIYFCTATNTWKRVAIATW